MAPTQVAFMAKKRKPECRLTEDSATIQRRKLEGDSRRRTKLNAALERAKGADFIARCRAAELALNEQDFFSLTAQQQHDRVQQRGAEIMDLRIRARVHASCFAEREGLEYSEGDYYSLGNATVESAQAHLGISTRVSGFSISTRREKIDDRRRKAVDLVFRQLQSQSHSEPNTETKAAIITINNNDSHSTSIPSASCTSDPKAGAVAAIGAGQSAIITPSPLQLSDTSVRPSEIPESIVERLRRPPEDPQTGRDQNKSQSSERNIFELSMQPAPRSHISKEKHVELIERYDGMLKQRDDLSEEWQGALSDIHDDLFSICMRLCDKKTMLEKKHTALQKEHQEMKEDRQTQQRQHRQLQDQREELLAGREKLLDHREAYLDHREEFLKQTELAQKHRNEDDK